MLKPGIKTKWINALRSGKYTQGKERLCRTNPLTGKDEMCCLGVLFDIASDRYWEELVDSTCWIAKGEYSESTTHFPGGSETGDLDDDIESHLMSLNDDEDYTFKMIANWLEEEKDI